MYFLSPQKSSKKNSKLKPISDNWPPTSFIIEVIKFEESEIVPAKPLCSGENPIYWVGSFFNGRSALIILSMFLNRMKQFEDFRCILLPTEKCRSSIIISDIIRVEIQNLNLEIEDFENQSWVSQGWIVSNAKAKAEKKEREGEMRENRGRREGGRGGERD